MEWLRETVAALDVPPLGAVGLQPAQYAEVAEKAARSSSMQGNPIGLSTEELSRCCDPPGNDLIGRHTPDVPGDGPSPGYNRTVSDSPRRAPTGVSPATRRVRIRWAVVAVLLFVAIIGWAVPVAATEKIAGQPSPAEPAADVFLSGVTTPRDGDEGLWMSWSLVDTARERRVGSANSDTDRTNSESSIKAWIAADYLRVVQAEGRAVTAAERADIAAMVRSSDNAAAQRLYGALGGDEILRHLRSVCGVTVSTRPGLLVADPDHGGGRHADLRCVLRTCRRTRAGTISSTDCGGRPRRRLRDQGGPAARRRCRSRTGGCRTRRRGGSGT